MSPPKSRPLLSLVIPAYNEEGAIEQTIAQAKRLEEKLDCDLEIVVVDDGSRDGTPDVLRNLRGISVLTHPHNRGYGAALKTGLDSCKGDWVAIVDADGTYPIEDLTKLTEKIHDGADMAVGARKGSGITGAPLRFLARYVLRKLVHALTGTYVPDLNSGMRVFRRALYTNYKHLLPMGFSFTTTITVVSLYNGFRVDYLRVEYEKRQGKSHIHPIRDFTAFTMLIVRLATYFDPLRFFIPLAGFFFVAGFLKGTRDFLLLGYLGSLSVVLFVVSLNVFLTGILADVIVRHFNRSGTSRAEPLQDAATPNVHPLPTRTARTSSK